MTTTVTLPKRKVYKTLSGQYVVHEMVNPMRPEQHLPVTWKAISKAYNHSTSAFAALGRITQRDTKKEMNQ